MPVRKTKLNNGEIYHIVLRGIEKRLLFQSEDDYRRAIRNIIEFNDAQRTSWTYRQNYYETRPRSSYPQGERKVNADRDQLLVSVLAFCLMPNHIHLLLQQKKENGISLLMRKFGTGYAGYFNRKYERQGYLFQGRFKAIHIKTDNQLRSVFIYIHTNPASLVDSCWKEGGIKNIDQTIKFIENYKWSSYSDYLGKENFLSAIDYGLFNGMMNTKEWQKFVNEWVKYKSFRGWDKRVKLE